MKITDFAVSNLSARQLQFVDALCSVHGGASEYTRQELKDICDSTGIYACPPSWITQDSRRSLDRGVYAVPECAERFESGSVELGRGYNTCRSAPAAAPAAPAAAPAPAGLDRAAMTLGMTGGDRATLVPAKNKSFVPWGHFTDVNTILSSGMFYPIFITGLTGNGKTTMVEQICAKLKRECYRVNITRQTDEDDLLGGFRLINGETKFCYGPVVEAMRSGGVLLLDEIDLGGPNLMCLQSVLEGKGIFLKKVGEWITPAEGFTVVATANTKGKGSDSGNYAHTGIMNEAMLDRFPITLEQPYASRATEKKILDKAGCGDADFADHLTKWAEIVRKAFAEGAVDEIISTRRLVDIVKANNIFTNKEKAIAFCLARFDEDTKEAFMSLYGKVDEQFNEFDAEHAASAANEIADDQKVPY